MPKKKKIYAVAVGRTTGLFREWTGSAGAQCQVTGFPGAVFKGFTDIADAKAFLDDPGKKTPAKKKVKDLGGSVNNDVKGRIIIYTDGSALNNPGPGGYGVVISKDSNSIELSGGYRLTTNNRMELMASIAALTYFKKSEKIALYTDSRYVANGISKGWAKNWRKNGWIKSNKQPALNPDLWGRLLDLCDKHDVKFLWVKGHAGNPNNERCDVLARNEAEKGNLTEDQGYLPSQQSS